MSIHPDSLTPADLSTTTDHVDRNGTIDLKAIVKPLVNLVWLAGLVFVLGSLDALWPDAREERRLADRYGQLRARCDGRRARAGRRARGRRRSSPSPGRSSASPRRRVTGSWNRAPRAAPAELVEQRDRALAALKELEFDHRTGKVTDEDYRERVGPLRRAAADALRALEWEDRPSMSAGSWQGGLLS